MVEIHFTYAVIYKCVILLFVPLCYGFKMSCHGGLRSSTRYGTKWKLCVGMPKENTLRFKIRNLFTVKHKSWLTIGCPPAGKKISDHSPLFRLRTNGQEKTIYLKQTNIAKKSATCTVVGKHLLKVISVDCHFGSGTGKYLRSEKIKIFWNTGKKTNDIAKEWKYLKTNHTELNFSVNHKNHKLPSAKAGSTAMRLLRNYGKSMGAIFGVSFAVTALIATAICCCCKKKLARDHFKKKKLNKNSSVSFYRDDTEADGRSDAESDDDEKVAFIRSNNNDGNKSV